METTLDGLLDRRVTLEQPASGYRVAIDTVLLAAAVPAQAGESVLDLGCGVGGALLCLAGRVPEIAVTGIEIDGALVQLCRNNMTRNKFVGRTDVMQGDITQMAFAKSSYDHAMMNPPYHEEARHDVSAHAQKRVANTEKTGDLDLWIKSAAQALKPEGILTLIHRADRKEEILGLLSPFFGTTEILPILPKSDTSPKRILLRARKSGKQVITYCKSFVLHQPDGRYTEEAEAVLRHMKALEFTPVK